MNYSDFVKEKVAPPQIFSERAQKVAWPVMHNFHAALGLLGETIELYLADTQENRTEEVGDIRFYIQFFANTFYWPSYEVLTSRITSENIKHLWSEYGCVTEMLEAAHELVDLHKKCFMYGQEFNIDKAFHYYERFVIAFYVYIGDYVALSLPQIEQLNMAKLDKRYEEGFTTEESAKRADKE